MIKNVFSSQMRQLCDFFFFFPFVFVFVEFLLDFAFINISTRKRSKEKKKKKKERRKNHRIQRRYIHNHRGMREENKPEAKRKREKDGRETEKKRPRCTRRKDNINIEENSTMVWQICLGKLRILELCPNG